MEKNQLDANLEERNPIYQLNANKDLCNTKMRNFEIIKVIAAHSFFFRKCLTVLTMFSVLQQIEISKSRLRSRITFSPLEDVLQRAIINYRNHIE